MPLGTVLFVTKKGQREPSPVALLVNAGFVEGALVAGGVCVVLRQRG